MSEGARWRAGIIIAALGLVVAILAWQMPKSATDSSVNAGTPQQMPAVSGNGSGDTGPLVPTVSPAPLASATQFLSDISPLNSHSAVGRTGAIPIGGVEFSHSLELCCGDEADVIWHVSGSRFVARVGVADDAMNAFEKTIDIQFYDQSGHELNPPVIASVGTPVDVDFPIAGVVQLQIRWTTRDIQGAGVWLTLGDPHTTSI